MNKLQRWAKYDWVAAFVLTPILFAPTAFPPVLAIGAFALVPVFLALIFFRYPTARSPFNLPILFLLSAVLLSLYASVDLSVSLPALCGILLALVMLYTLVTHPTRVSPSGILVFAYLLGLALAILTFAAPIRPDKFAPLVSLTLRLPDSVGAAVLALHQGRALNGNVAAGMLLLVLPLNLVGLWLLARSFPIRPARATRPVTISVGLVRAVLLVSFVLILCAFVLAQSRSAFLGLGSALVFLAWFRFPAQRPALTVASIAFILLATIVLLQIRVPVATSFLLNDTLVGNLPAREEIWKRSSALFQDFPFTGIGLGTFSPVANALYPFFLHSPTVLPPHAHNLLLQAAVELGLFGLIGYVGLILVFAICLRLAFRRTTDLPERWTILGLGAGMLAYQVYGLTDATGIGTHASLPFWLALGAAGCMYARLRPKEPIAVAPLQVQPPKMAFLSRASSTRPVGGSGLSLLAGSLVLIAGIIFALALPGAWGCAFRVNPFAIEVVRSVVPWGPGTVRLPLWLPHSDPVDRNDFACSAPVNRLAGIELLVVRQDAAAAIARLETALAADPSDFGAELWLARATEQNGDFERAVALWKHLGNFRHLRELARAGEHDGSLDRAIYIWHSLGNASRLEQLARKSEVGGDLDPAIRIWQLLGNTKRLEEIASAGEQGGEIERALRIWRGLGNIERIRTLAGRSLKTDDLNHAAAALDVLQELAPQDQQLDSLSLQLAEQYAAGGEFDRAIPYFRRVLERNPHNQSVRLRQIQVVWQSGAVQEAFTLLVSSLCMAPDNQPLWNQFSTFVLNSDHATLLQLLETIPPPNCAPKVRAQSLQQLAAEANKRADIEVAILVWQELGDADALREIVTRIESTDTRMLELSLTALTRVAPADGSNYVRLARLLMAEGKSEQARELLEGAAAKHVDSPWLYLLLGDLYRSRHENAQEIESYRRALAHLSDPGPLYLPLGIALFENQELKQAAVYLQHATEFKPDDAQGHFYLARALWGIEKWEGAMEELALTMCLRPVNESNRTLWNASVQEAIKRGVTRYSANFDYSKCSGLTHVAR